MVSNTPSERVICPCQVKLVPPNSADTTTGNGSPRRILLISKKAKSRWVTGSLISATSTATVVASAEPIFTNWPTSARFSSTIPMYGARITVRSKSPSAFSNSASANCNSATASKSWGLRRVRAEAGPVPGFSFNRRL